MEKHKELVDLVASLQADFVKFFDNGNKAAGTRVRAGMQQVTALAKTIRADVSAIKNGGKGPTPEADGDSDGDSATMA